MNVQCISKIDDDSLPAKWLLSQPETKSKKPGLHLLASASASPRLMVMPEKTESGRAPWGGRAGVKESGGRTIKDCLLARKAALALNAAQLGTGRQAKLMADFVFALKKTAFIPPHPKV